MSWPKANNHCRISKPNNDSYHWTDDHPFEKAEEEEGEEEGKKGEEAPELGYEAYRNLHSLFSFTYFTIRGGGQLWNYKSQSVLFLLLSKTNKQTKNTVAVRVGGEEEEEERG